MEILCVEMEKHEGRRARAGAVRLETLRLQPDTDVEGRRVGRGGEAKQR